MKNMHGIYNHEIDFYRAKAVYYSKLFRDEPMKPMDRAIFWIEYVIRNGGDVLKSPALQLSFVQLALLDVYLFLLFIIILAFAIIIWSIKFILKSCVPKHNKKSINLKKKVK